VGEILQTIPINKAVDLDRIPARMLRTLQKKLFLQSITYLVNNKSIMDGNVPIL
jgi:hypothetical protein